MILTQPQWAAVGIIGGFGLVVVLGIIEVLLDWLDAKQCGSEHGGKRCDLPSDHIGETHVAKQPNGALAMWWEEPW